MATDLLENFISLFWEFHEIEPGLLHNGPIGFKTGSHQIFTYRPVVIHIPMVRNTQPWLLREQCTERQERNDLGEAMKPWLHL